MCSLGTFFYSTHIFWILIAFICMFNISICTNRVTLYLNCSGAYILIWNWLGNTDTLGMSLLHHYLFFSGHIDHKLFFKLIPCPEKMDFLCPHSKILMHYICFRFQYQHYICLMFARVGLFLVMFCNYAKTFTLW